MRVRDSVVVVVVTTNFRLTVAIDADPTLCHHHQVFVFVVGLRPFFFP
jgi:hypothetical protein